MRAEVRKVEKEEVAGKYESTYRVDTLETPPMRSTVPVLESKRTQTLALNSLTHPPISLDSLDLRCA